MLLLLDQLPGNSAARLGGGSRGILSRERVNYAMEASIRQEGRELPANAGDVGDGGVAHPAGLRVHRPRRAGRW